MNNIEESCTYKIYSINATTFLITKIEFLLEIALKYFKFFNLLQNCFVFENFNILV